MLTIQTSFASFPGMTHAAAAQEAVKRAAIGHPVEPGLASALASSQCTEVRAPTLRIEHVQLVPQSFGHLSMQLAEDLMNFMPNTKFRLHANVRVLRSHRLADLSSFEAHQDWFEQAARISKMLDAPAYTAHSGRRANATMSEMLDNTRRCADLFGCPVGIEGQYPTKSGEFLVNSWAEYREVFDSGLHYAIDLSHLKILARSTGERNETLIAEMLASNHCIEVHVSDNDGRGDWHQVCESAPWWAPLMKHINRGAVIFTEGNQLRKHHSQADHAPRSDT